MSMSRAFRRLLTAWIAIAAIALAALAPAVSTAFGMERSVVFVELCTEDGMRMVAVDAHGTPDPGVPGSGHAQAHCPACLLPPHGYAPLPVLPSWVPEPLFAHAAPAAFLQAPRTQHAWLAAQPRGPPLQG